MANEKPGVSVDIERSVHVALKAHVDRTGGKIGWLASDILDKWLKKHGKARKAGR